MTSLATDKTDHDALVRAVELMNAPSLTAKLADLAGAPLEAMLRKLSPDMRQRVNRAVADALGKAADAALWTMDDKPGNGASTVLHKLGAAASGAIGGFFGFAALLVEIPVSITIMMRAVADVARAEGFSLTDVETRAICVQIFGMESGMEPGKTHVPGHQYFAAKEALRQVMGLTAAELSAGAVKGLTTQEAASWLVRLVEAVAARLGIAITEKVAAQMIPVLGAITGAAINALFTDHYQDMAKARFTLERLERKYGEGELKAALAALATTPA